MEYEVNGGVNTITGDVEWLEAHGGVLYVKGKVGTLVHHGGVMYDQRPSNRVEYRTDRMSEEERQRFRRRIAELERRLILERNRHIALYDAIGSLLKETKENPEKDLRKSLEKMMKEKKNMYPLTLQSLGVGENDDIEDDEEVDDE